ncbi:uncharacterized protein NPIL_394001 [Nephila pilipes]|uniref:Uncharacterized protein n=1 Tax=Nephila pilipes TaxID=299642 RepID=A0A8X6UMI9_NEPPI|nr:uncharacterized protein NPIL_394001 [Nephila pilipes]
MELNILKSQWDRSITRGYHCSKRFNSKFSQDPDYRWMDPVGFIRNYHMNVTSDKSSPFVSTSCSASMNQTRYGQEMIKRKQFEINAGLIVMDSMLLEDNETCKNSFDALSFERKLVELVEELRLRRNLEAENEKNLKSLMDEKYKMEVEWDEQQRRHSRERNELEQQISLLKRKLEDKVCGSDDEKVKQHIMNKTYSEEIRLLKEELRNATQLTDPSTLITFLLNSKRHGIMIKTAV